MKKEEIVQKSISGVKWTVILSIITIPISYIINIILGRLSPEALGIYGFANIFVASITTFILFGGGSVVIKYLPEVEGKKQISFLFSYSAIVLLISLLIIIFTYNCPQILKIAFGQDFPLYLLNLFILLVPVIILYSLFDAVLNALMEIKSAIIIKKINIFGNFFVFLFLFVFCKEFFRDNLWTIILSLIFLFNLILAYLAFLAIWGKMNGGKLNKKIENKKNLNNIFHLESQNKLEFYLPKNFWSFTLFTHISTIVYYIYDKLDQLLILKDFNIEELGYYYAALQTAMLIRIIPQLMGTILLPTFSNLLASQEIELLQVGYQKIVKYNTLIVIPSSLFLIFFSEQIMGLFGDSYVKYHSILVIFGIFYSFTPMTGINSSLIIAKGKTGVYLFNSVLQVSLQFILMFILINSYGILGVAIGRGMGLVLAQFGLNIIVIKLLNLGVKTPRAYKVGIFTAFISSTLYYLIPTQNLDISIILFLLTSIFFVYFSDYSIEDFDIILKNVLKNKEG